MFVRNPLISEETARLFENISSSQKPDQAELGQSQVPDLQKKCSQVFQNTRS